MQHGPAEMIIALGHKKVKPDEQEEAKGNEEGKQAAAEDFLKAIEAKDADGLIEAFENLFAICESEPHDEAE